MDERTNDAGQPPNIRCGESFTRTIAFDADDIRRFAALAGDTNPLHHDASFAAKSRFGHLIACGAHSSGRMMSAVADYLSERGEVLGLGFSFQFRKAVLEGSVLELVWTVSGVAETVRLDGHKVNVEGTLRDRDGTVHVVATGTALVPRNRAGS